MTAACCEITRTGDKVGVHTGKTFTGLVAEFTPCEDTAVFADEHITNWTMGTEALIFDKFAAGADDTANKCRGLPDTAGLGASRTCWLSRLGRVLADLVWVTAAMAGNWTS